MSANRNEDVALRKQKGPWGEFELYVLPGSKEPVVYVIPSGSIKANTVISLNNERLALYRNNWSLLTQPAEVKEIEWKPKALREPIVRKPRIPKPPKETPLAIVRTVDEAEKHGLAVGRPHLASQYQLYISAKSCQIMQTRPVPGTPYIPVNLPKSDWAEFLIFFVRPSETAITGNFYVVPRMKLPKHTVLSPTSSWLREHLEAWELLKPESRLATPNAGIAK